MDFRPNFKTILCQFKILSIRESYFSAFDPRTVFGGGSSRATFITQQIGGLEAAAPFLLVVVARIYPHRGERDFFVKGPRRSLAQRHWSRRGFDYYICAD